MTKSLKTDISLVFDDVAPRYDSNQINEFKMKHNIQIQKYSKSEKILLITDSIYSVIQK